MAYLVPDDPLVVSSKSGSSSTACRYEFRGFPFFSRLLARGSRLRLVFHSPNTIHLQKNYNSGGAVVDESGKDARTAHVRLFHDAEHASSLVVPVAEEERRRASENV